MGETLPLDEYRTVALETASYEAIDGISFLYPAVGCGSELGEVADVIKKLWRDADGVLDHSWVYKLVMEIGDAMWFLVALEKEFGVKVSLWLNDTSESHPMTTVLKMNQASGQLSACVHKICIADPSCREQQISLYRPEIGKRLSSIFFCLNKLADFIGVSLEEILAANIHKLKYRREASKHNQCWLPITQNCV